MFPVEFADAVVSRYTQPGDTVLDPFAGRGTAVFSAAVLNRLGIGIEINPVGYVYAAAKLGAASREEVEERLNEIGNLSVYFGDEASRLPRFFHCCFSRSVRRFLVTARQELNWRRSKVDRTLMALLLVSLHGKAGTALSNQLRQTKAMSPQYAIRWWKEGGYRPPQIDPVEFVKSRLNWRYAKGTPKIDARCRTYLGSSLTKLPQLQRNVEAGSLSKVDLLFTSPPYCAVTNYHYDQWLRLWLLGGSPNALREGHGRGGKFEGRDRYRKMLEGVFAKAAPLLQPDATVYVRTDARQFTYDTTVDVLKAVFNNKRMRQIRRPLLRPSQTSLFGERRTTMEHAGEVDLVLQPR